MQLWEVGQVHRERQVLPASVGEVGILEEMVEGSERLSGGTGPEDSPVSSACHWK